jgi:hypothetical protein
MRRTNARDRVRRRVRRAIGMIFVVFCAGMAVTQPSSAQDLLMNWWTVDGGGDMWTTGGDYELSGTIGQPDASEFVMTGGDFELTGDLDGDGDTDQSDLGILLADWGCTENCPGDLDGDDDTDQSDLGILLADWGCGR